MKNKIIQILRNITGYNELQKKNEDQELRIMYLEDTIMTYEDLFRDLTQELGETKTKKEAAETTIKDMLHKETVNIEDVKHWYENRFGTRNWTYNFRGKGAEDTHLAFRYKDNEEGPKKLRNLSNEIIKRYSLVAPTPLILIEKVKQYFNVRSHWVYVADRLNPIHPGVLDYWQEVDVSIDKRRGDCEDLALLMHSLILDLFLIFGFTSYSWRLKLSAGFVLGEGGHAYNVWLHDDGEWYVIESTYDLSGSFSRTWLKTPLRNNNLYVDVWGFARPDRSFKGYGVSSLSNYRE